MFPDLRGATEADLEAAYDSHFDALWDIARELEIPPAEAAELIDEALFAALLLKNDLDPEKWLVATVKAAAKRSAGRRR